jgi:hypothetical protein
LVSASVAEQRAAPVLGRTAPIVEESAPVFEASAQNEEANLFSNRHTKRTAGPALVAVELSAAPEAVAGVVEDRAAAVIREAAPMEEVAAPVFELGTPILEVPELAVEETATILEASAPVIEEAAPIIQVAAPIIQVAAPALDAATPVVEEAALVVEQAAPVVEQAAIIEEEAASETFEAADLDQTPRPHGQRRRTRRIQPSAGAGTGLSSRWLSRSPSRASSRCCSSRTCRPEERSIGSQIPRFARNDGIRVPLRMAMSQGERPRVAGAPMEMNFIPVSQAPFPID